MAKPHEKLVYKEAYVRPGRAIKAAYHPELKHLATGTVVEVFLREAGRVEREGIELEYQDLRVYIKVEEAAGG